MPFKFVQYNVRSIKKRELRKSLAVLAKKSRAAIMRLQETRGVKTGTICSDEYIQCRSAAVKGNGGCEVWILMPFVFAISGVQKRRIDSDNVTYLYTSESMLIIFVTTTLLSAVIVTAHAPHSAASNHKQ